MNLSQTLQRFLLTFVLLGFFGANPTAAQEPATPIMTQTQKITTSDAMAHDGFINASINGAHAIIGASGSDDQGFSAGKAYVFRLSGIDWIEEQVLLPAEIEAGDAFGYVAALTEGSALISSADDGAAGIDQGAVYHFELEGGSWAQKPTLRAFDAAERDDFGQSLSTDGRWLAIGSPGDDDAGTDFGAVYIYEKISTSWIFRHKIVPTGLGSLERFGFYSSIQDERLLIGSIANSRAFVYRLDPDTAQPEFESELTALDGGEFSGPMALDGDTALVGASRWPGPGAVYVFKRSATTWAQQSKLFPSDGQEYDSFGSALSLDGNVAVIGANNKSLNNAYRGGQAYIFERPDATTAFSETLRLQPSDQQSFDFFGQKVAIDAGSILIGSSTGEAAGAVYYYDPACPFDDANSDVLRVLLVDLQSSTNEMAHHTTKYRVNDMLMLRRGSTLETKVTVDSRFDPGVHELKLRAIDNLSNLNTVIDIPIQPSGSNDIWWAEADDPQGIGAKTVQLTIHIPGSAPVGEYSFAVTALRQGLSPRCWKGFPDRVAILFDPWNANDEVYLPSAFQRDEYLMQEKGILWLDKQNPFPWSFDQFDETAFLTTLLLLDGTDPLVRSSAVKVSRHLSARVNKEDDGGILVGNWSGSYSDGRHPGSWQGSSEIMAQYYTLRTPVSYGQCWVFSGLLNTTLRAIGIPTRSITNYSSGHDANGDNRIEVCYQSNGHGGAQPVICPGRTSTESMWNFHVWNEAWMSRDDGYGWQAVDATPQERSDGLFQLGPASVRRVRDIGDGQFDVRFVKAEVDGDYVAYWCQAGSCAPTDSSTTDIGKDISTKAIGGGGRVDITASYKTPGTLEFGLGSESDAVRRPARPGADRVTSGLMFGLTGTSLVNVGDDIVWTMAITSTSGTTHTVQATLDGLPIVYNGNPLPEIDLAGVEEMVVVPPGAVRAVVLRIPIAAYRAILSATTLLRVVAVGEVIGTGQTFAEVADTTVSLPSIRVELLPEPVAQLGMPVSASTEVINPLGADLHNAKLSVIVGAGALVNGTTRVDFPIGTLGAGASAVYTPTVIASVFDIHPVSAVLLADELGGMSGVAYLDARPDAGDCNADSLIDAGDVSAGILEVFDSDGSDPAVAGDGTFPGNPRGCDSNRDNRVDAGDIACTVLTVFNIAGGCGG